jgi:hypothetical protein
MCSVAAEGRTLSPQGPGATRFAGVIRIGVDAQGADLVGPLQQGA